MGVSNLFSLPYLGMKDGFHEYHFKVDSDFFTFFEHSPIENGEFDIDVSVDKRGNISEFSFNIVGKMRTICDRCLTEIKIPVTGKFVMHGKVSLEVGDNEDIIYIAPDQSHIDMRQYFYEMICLSLPLINVYDCEKEEPPVCDKVVLAKISKEMPAPEEEIENENVWSSLKGLISDN
jgi:uncharacterized metal-binding protein YceD (DUF177 family)